MEIVTLGVNRQNTETKEEKNLIRINKESNFPLAIKLSKSGQVVPFPECDFTMEAHIEGSSDIYRAKRKGSVCKHCKQDGDRLIIFFDNHNFVEGRLLLELTIEYPDPDFSEDGIRQEHFKEITPIQIVADNGDALDLRLPEPRVVEKVVEKIVEKETDHYTDLQKKAAAWVAGIDTSADPSYPLILDYFLKNITDIGSLTATFQGGYMNGANETDPDFNEKLKLAKICFSTPYLTTTGTSCFEGMNTPHLDLDLFSMGQCDISNSFNDTIVNTLTITAQGYFAGYGISDNNQDEILQNAGKLFLGCVAKKVRITKSTMSNKNVYYYLATIKDSKVECFEFEENNKEHALDINIVAEKILPDVSQDEHKPKLIFRNVVGTVNEELKQKILAKGYPSVEFFEGDTKVL